MRLLDYTTTTTGKSKAKVFYGTLTPTDWDKDDYPIAFSLYSIDEEDIPLEAAPHVKKKLLKLSNRPVEITGEVHTDVFGDDYVFVKKVKRLNFPQFRLLSLFQKKKEESDEATVPHLVAKNVLEKMRTDQLSCAI